MDLPARPKECEAPEFASRNARRSVVKLLVVGGLASSLVNFRGSLLRSVRLKGYDVVAAAGAPLEPTRTHLGKWGIRLRPLRLERARVSVRGELVLLADLARVLSRERPSHVLAYTIKPVVYLGLLAYIFRRPRYTALVTGLGYAFGQETNRQRIVGSVARLLYRFALRRYQTVIFQNPDDLADFRARGLLPHASHTGVVNGSGVDLDEYARADVPDIPRFLMVARLVREKGVREFVEAARIVKRSCPQAEFALVGAIDANPNSVTKEEIEAWSAEGMVTYHGRSNEVWKHMASASVFVLPSYREGTPRTVLEAMSVGRAIITTDAPGCRETVSDGVNGLLVPIRNVDALAAAMISLAKDPDRIALMGAKSREYVAAKYDVNLVNAEMIRLMEL